MTSSTCDDCVLDTTLLSQQSTNDLELKKKHFFFCEQTENLCLMQTTLFCKQTSQDHVIQMISPFSKKQLIWCCKQHDLVSRYQMVFWAALQSTPSNKQTTKCIGYCSQHSCWMISVQWTGMMSEADGTVVMAVIWMEHMEFFISLFDSNGTKTSACILKRKQRHWLCMCIFICIFV